MSPRNDLMENLQPVQKLINLAEKDRYIEAEGKGNIHLITETEEGQRNIVMKNLLYVPKSETVTALSNGTYQRKIYGQTNEK